VEELDRPAGPSRPPTLCTSSCAPKAHRPYRSTDRGLGSARCAGPHRVQDRLASFDLEAALPGSSGDPTVSPTQCTDGVFAAISVSDSIVDPPCMTPPLRTVAEVANARLCQGVTCRATFELGQALVPPKTVRIPLELIIAARTLPASAWKQRHAPPRPRERGALRDGFRSSTSPSSGLPRVRIPFSGGTYGRTKQ